MSDKKNIAQNKQSRQREKRPEWAPEDGGKAFACRVQNGVSARHDGTLHNPEQVQDHKQEQSRKNLKKIYRRPSLTLDEYEKRVLKGDRMILARAITLVESNARRHADQAQELLKRLLPHTGNSIRIGITGVPGVGKSTFIEALGCYLTKQGHKVAVLAVDPSSSISGGSILGDKTRMEELCQDPNCFIRPSPTSGSLGGVARKTRESMLVCEAAGFDIILIETVGVGQSEVTVRSMVDFFLLLMLTGAGDELQGIKKGIMEIANALIINKADGDNKLAAQQARAEYERALHYLQPATQGWSTHAHTCSSLTKEEIPKVWKMILAFKKTTVASGVFARFRQEQTVKWVHDMIQEHLQTFFFRHPKIIAKLPEIETAVTKGTLPAVTAVRQLLDTFHQETDPADADPVYF